LLVAIGDLDAHRLARGDGKHLVGGEFALGKNIEHLAPDIAGGADDGDFVTHEKLLLPAARGSRADVWEGQSNVKAPEALSDL